MTQGAPQGTRCLALHRFRRPNLPGPNTSAGTTPMLSPPAALSQHSPRRCMVAGAFLGPYAAIDAGLDQTRRDCRAEEKMIEPQACITRPPVSLVIPESKHRFGRMKGAQRVAPALRDQRFERGAGF